MVKHFLYLCACVVLLVQSLAAQTVELSTRTFWLGERPKTMDIDTPFIAVREIDWIDAALVNDPVLQDAVVHIELAFTSVASSVAAPREDELLLGSDRLLPAFDLPDYRVYGSPVPTARDFVYVPVDPMAGFIVRCGLRDDVVHMSLCVVYATYAPDDRIRLKARLYFPPDPAETPTYFRDVASRMREVAYCLDVTEEIAERPKVHRNLSECRPEPVS